MTIHRIRLLGDPILRARCEPITKPNSTAVRVILDDMRETLRDWQSRFGSGRGIAAPQIGVNLRVIQQYLGHTSLETTMVYLHLTNKGQEDAVAHINTLMEDL